jgi:hypothetical protein
MEKKYPKKPQATKTDSPPAVILRDTVKWLMQNLEVKGRQEISHFEVLTVILTIVGSNRKCSTGHLPSVYTVA